VSFLLRRPKADGLALVLVAHDEGPYLPAAVNCALAGLRSLQQESIPVAIRLMLHGADRATQVAAHHVARSSDLPIRLLRRRRHGPAEAWMAGIRQTNVPWIALATVDDLLTAPWFTEVFAAIHSLSEARRCIYHPSRLFGFEVEQRMQCLPDQQELQHPLAASLSQELWPGTCVAHRTVFQTCPLLPEDRPLLPEGRPVRSGGDLVLWSWHSRCLQQGFEHRVLEGTCQFRRLRAPRV